MYIMFCFEEINKIFSEEFNIFCNCCSTTKGCALGRSILLITGKIVKFNDFAKLK
uniref:Uncharacterized protein n=1 Tax=Meloidogyne enterolobii TaxID=390850 RepID=A0A6V7X715_MELEN|nr:unnamed protein product [Meloidogyne enterolobii]